MFRKLITIILLILLSGTSALLADAPRKPNGGLIVMEAELYDALVPAPSGEFNWEFETEISGFSAEGYLRSRPEGTNLWKGEIYVS